MIIFFYSNEGARSHGPSASLDSGRVLDKEKSRRPKTSPERNIKDEIKIHLHV
jgi:hypothetical protein